jgi:tryptophan synthase alpha subunit
MFAGLDEKNQGAFVPFVMVGDPDLAQSEAIICQLVESGADALELGIPYSDPIADGPTIQASAIRALSNKVTVADCLGVISRVRAKASKTFTPKRKTRALTQFWLLTFLFARRHLSKKQPKPLAFLRF